jgi:hypothetical protein
MTKASKVYVVQDGAINLWNIFQDRFASVAQGVLDFYHASDHLRALAHELFGAFKIASSAAANSGLTLASLIF